MRKLSVPYTIKRQGVYYLNIRWNDQIIRQSLATKEPMEAFQKVNQLTPIFSNANGCEQTVRQKISEIISRDRSVKGNELKLLRIDDSSLLLSQAFSFYREEQIIENWNVRTLKQNEATFAQLIEIMGDIPIRSITKSFARGYKQTLLSYPANRSKGARKRKSLKQLLEEGCETISLETVRNNLGRVSSFFNWMVKQGYRKDNPFSGIAPRRAHSARSQRSPFNDDDLKLIFGSDIFRHRKYDHEWQYWLPILALYTGARLEELCQLKGQDFKVIGDCHYIDINSDGDIENRVKTPSSVRKIPLHNELLRIGVIDALGKRSRTSFLFDLRRINTNLGHVPSKWFSAYKASLGLPKGTKVFHSFRHTLRDKLTSADVPSEHIREILGHEQLDETFGRYGSAIPMNLLRKSINKITFSFLL